MEASVERVTVCRPRPRVRDIRALRVKEARMDSKSAAAEANWA